MVGIRKGGLIMRKKRIWGQLMALVLSAAMVVSGNSLSALAGSNTYEMSEEQVCLEGETTLHNPVRNTDGSVVYDYVYFGNYWQVDTNQDGKANYDDDKTPIKWRVLNVTGNDAFLLCDKAMNFVNYNRQDIDITWENSTMRCWLNGYKDTYNEVPIVYADNFLENAFTKDEQAIIKDTLVSHSDSQADSSISGGNDTTDKIFCLSYEEATNSSYGFLNDAGEFDSARYIKCTPFAEEQGVTAYNVETPNTEWTGNTVTWLRTPGKSANSVAVIHAFGLVQGEGFTAYNPMSKTYPGVLPAMHIDLSKVTWGENISMAPAEDEKPGQPEATSSPKEPEKDPESNPTDSPTDNPGKEPGKEPDKEPDKEPEKTPEMVIVSVKEIDGKGTITVDGKKLTESSFSVSVNTMVAIQVEPQEGYEVGKILFNSDTLEAKSDLNIKLEQNSVISIVYVKTQQDNFSLLVKEKCDIKSMFGDLGGVPTKYRLETELGAVSKIASVTSKGILTAKKAGIVYVIPFVNGTFIYSKKLKVEIITTDIIAEKLLMVEVGQTIETAPLIDLPKNQSISWSITNPSNPVVNVEYDNKGNVKSFSAVRTGSVKLQAVVSYGNNQTLKITKTAKVKLPKLSVKDTIVVASGKSKAVSVTNLLKDATVEWSTDIPSIVYIENNAKTTTKVKLHISGASGEKAVVTAKVTEVVDGKKYTIPYTFEVIVK